MKPRMFIGSSVEGLPLARAIEVILQHSVHCVVWPNGFPVSESTVDSLIDQFGRVDFGLFILSPDDHTNMRNLNQIAPRDNVVFEVGLFMGRHGRARTFIAKPRDVKEFHMPTDLLGITTATFEGARSKTDARNALSAAATEIQDAIKRVQSTEPRIDMNIFAREEPTARWKLKVYIQMRNNCPDSVALRSISMDLDPEMPLDSGIALKGGRFIPEFGAGKDAAGNDIRKETIIIRPGESVQIFVPVRPDVGYEMVNRLVEGNSFALWTYEEHWLNEQGQTRILTKSI